MVRYSVEELEREERSIEDRRIGIQEELPIECVDVEEDGDSDEAVYDNSDDEDWVDIDVDPKGVEKNTVKVRKYNTLHLKNFAIECDRYGVPDRAAAKIGNGLLKDLGKVTKDNTSMLICPTRLRRERLKWGAKLEAECSKISLPHGLYTDGKRVPTLVRLTRETKVKVPGGRGRRAYRTVATTSNQLVVEHHYPVLAEPGGS